MFGWLFNKAPKKPPVVHRVDAESAIVKFYLEDGTTLKKVIRGRAWWSDEIRTSRAKDRFQQYLLDSQKLGVFNIDDQTFIPHCKVHDIIVYYEPYIIHVEER